VLGELVDRPVVRVVPSCRFAGHPATKKPEPRRSRVTPGECGTTTDLA
jgi:hypothetical protein